MDIEEIFNRCPWGYKEVRKAHDGNYYYLYRTTNLKNGKISVGAKKFSKLNLSLDFYIGGGIRYSQKRGMYGVFNKNTDSYKEVVKYGAENFKRERLLFFDSQEDLLKAENTIVNKEFLKRPDVLNMIVGGGNSPTGSGEKNNNYGRKWTDKMKADASRNFKENLDYKGGKNPKAVKCSVYDFLLDKNYELEYIRQIPDVLGFKLDYNWSSILKFRYIILCNGEEPYEKVKSLKKPVNTLRIIEYFKKGLTNDDVFEKMKDIYKNKGFINRVYKELSKSK